MLLPWSCHVASVVYVCMLGHMIGFYSSAAGMAHTLISVSAGSLNDTDCYVPLLRPALHCQYTPHLHY